jgi:purine-binding chemotaxis protein CheW
VKQKKLKKTVLKRRKRKSSKVAPPSSPKGKSEDMATDPAETTSQTQQSPSNATVVENEPEHLDLKSSPMGPGPQLPPTTAEIGRLPARPSDETVEETAASDGTQQLLSFLLGDEEYGVNILMIREIIRLTTITPVPRAPSYIKGIISLRGAVLPILDLHQLLSIPETQPDKKSRILVVNLEAGPIGIIVDAVTEVVELKEAELEPAPAVMTGLDADHIKGMGRYKGRLIVLLDLDKVYTTKHSQMMSKAGQEVPTPP